MKPDRSGIYRKEGVNYWCFTDDAGVMRTTKIDLAGATKPEDGDWQLVAGVFDATSLAMVYDATVAIMDVFLPADIPGFVRSQIAAAHDCYRQVMGEEPMSIKAAAAERTAGKAGVDG